MNYKTRIIQDVPRPVVRKCGLCQELRSSIHYDVSMMCPLCANCAVIAFEAEEELIAAGMEHPGPTLAIRNP